MHVHSQAHTQVAKIDPSLLELGGVSNRILSLTVNESLNTCEELLGQDLGWASLKQLNLQNNLITALDSSLDQLQVVQTINLSQNQISKIEFMTGCLCLDFLDLSFNMIESLEGVALGALKILHLRGNQIFSVNGLENLRALEELNLAENRIADYKGMERLRD